MADITDTLCTLHTDTGISRTTGRLIRVICMKCIDRDIAGHAVVTVVTEVCAGIHTGRIVAEVVTVGGMVHTVMVDLCHIKIRCTDLHGTCTMTS